MEEQLKKSLARFEEGRKVVDLEVQAAAYATTTAHYSLSLRHVAQLKHDSELAALERQAAEEERREAKDDRIRSAETRAEMKILAASLSIDRTGYVMSRGNFQLF